MRLRKIIAAATFAVLPMWAWASETAEARLTGPDGAELGIVTLTEGPHGVLVQLRATGLAPGEHGFHIHETGACTPDFAAAGDHYNPTGAGHGFMADGGLHAGDLPNVHADADGMANVDVFTDAVSLADDAPNTLFDADGSAIIIHEKADSYGAEAGAGGLVACGVIERR